MHKTDTLISSSQEDDGIVTYGSMWSSIAKRLTPRRQEDRVPTKLMTELPFGDQTRLTKKCVDRAKPPVLAFRTVIPPDELREDEFTVYRGIYMMDHCVILFCRPVEGGKRLALTFFPKGHFVFTGAFEFVRKLSPHKPVRISYFPCNNAIASIHLSEGGEGEAAEEKGYYSRWHYLTRI